MSSKTVHLSQRGLRALRPGHDRGRYRAGSARQGVLWLFGQVVHTGEGFYPTSFLVMPVLTPWRCGLLFLPLRFLSRTQYRPLTSPFSCGHLRHAVPSRLVGECFPSAIRDQKALHTGERRVWLLIRNLQNAQGHLEWCNLSCVTENDAKLAGVHVGPFPRP